MENVEMEEVMDEEEVQEKISFWKKANFKRNAKLVGAGLALVASFVLGEKVQKNLDEKKTEKSEVSELPESTETVEPEVTETI